MNKNQMSDFFERLAPVLQERKDEAARVSKPMSPERRAELAGLKGINQKQRDESSPAQLVALEQESDDSWAKNPNNPSPPRTASPSEVEFE